MNGKVLLKLFLVILIFTSCKKGDSFAKVDVETGGSPAITSCQAGSTIIDNSTVGGAITHGPSTVNNMNQSFKLTCENGKLDSITLLLNAMSGTSAVKLELYAGGSPGSLNSFVDQVTVTGIVTGAFTEYTFDFPSNPTLEVNQTYWLSLDVTGATSMAVWTTGATNNYTNGSLYVYILGSYQVDSDDVDLWFKANLE